MCRFITAVVPAGIDLHSAKPLLDKYGMSFKEVRNPFLEAQLEGDRYLRATRSTCDCDSVLGSASNREAIQTAAADTGDIEKLKKKGWSQHKIERWLAEKSGTTDRHQHTDRSKSVAELVQWREFISAMLSDKSTDRLGLLIHMYNGTLEDEQIQIKGINHISLSEQFENSLLEMEEDVLYLVSET